MTLPLCDNPAHRRHLCTSLGLGDELGAPDSVRGGFHHSMWRLVTTRGQYAIKQLSADAEPGAAETMRHYNATECVAALFAGRGIPALHALQHNARYLHTVEGESYLVYPWVDAAALHKHEIQATHVRQVAAVLAAMHSADIVVPDLADVPADSHPAEKMIALVEMAQACNARHAQSLGRQLADFLCMAQRQAAALRLLGERQVISHGDLDHRNVLWDGAGRPLVIDWESARRLNPTYEILLEALDWSGITSTFEPGLFRDMIAAYSQAGGVIEVGSLRAAFDCVLGDWLNWLMFNVGRCVDIHDAQQRALGAGQVDLSLSTMLRLQRLKPNVLGMLDL